MAAWGWWGTQRLHQCNSYFAMLPQHFRRSLSSVQGLPTMVLPFWNPPYFDVFISGLFCPSVSHRQGQGRADGHLCDTHKWRVDGKREMTRCCWWGGVAMRALWARLITWCWWGMPRSDAIAFCKPGRTWGFAAQLSHGQGRGKGPSQCMAGAPSLGALWDAHPLLSLQGGQLTLLSPVVVAHPFPLRTLWTHSQLSLALGLVSSGALHLPLTFARSQLMVFFALSLACVRLLPALKPLDI